MTRRTGRSMLMLMLILAAPMAAAAQTLPQSTVDRQTIANLQYQLTQPGTTPQQRLVIKEQISELEYQINTRPLITPPGGTRARLAPQSSPGPVTQSASPHAMPQTPVEPQHYGYGSCDADRAMIAYLTAQLHEPSISQQERTYIPDQIRELQSDLRARHC